MQDYYRPKRTSAPAPRRTMPRSSGPGLLSRLFGGAKALAARARNARASRGNSPRAPRQPRNPGNRRDWRKIWTRVGVVCAVLFFAGTIGAIAVVAWVAKDLPDPSQIGNRQVAETTTIYDRTGEHVLYQIHGDQKRTVVKLDQIAEHMKQATIAVEDKDFYTHGGLDFRGMARSMYYNIFKRQAGGNLRSGSTITQQFIKKSILTDDQTPIRKAREIILALELERRFSKDEILYFYLNEIPYGSVAYGAESAAQTFFGKHASELSLSESAVLAALPNAPTLYSPYGNHVDRLISRKDFILDRMVEEGFVTREEADEAKADDVLARVLPRREPITAPHFVFYVKDLLAEELGESALEEDGLKIYTTLDYDKQMAAEKAIADNAKNLESWKATSAALVSIDPRNGDILAMVGSADYFNKDINGQYNAVLGRLQPGSSIKPMVYAAAFEKGYTPDTVVMDVKTEFGTGGQSYSPNNYDLQERGPMTFRESLAGSLNTPAVKALYLTGLDKFQDFARRVGYTTFEDKSRFGLSLVLGGAEVRMLEHASAFGAFAQEGTYRPSRAILRVEQKDGTVTTEAPPEVEGKKSFDVQVARQINGIMSDNALRAYVFGEKNWLTLPDRAVAAKTGTTNNFKDAWTVGYTPSLVTAVWVGDSTGNSTMKQGADGSKIAAPIWNQYMRDATKGTAAESFTPAEPVVTGKPILDGDKNSQVTVKVDKVTGKLATEHTPAEYVEERRYGVPHDILFFVNKDEPRGDVPEHPEEDPQFANWEAAVAAWVAARQAEGTVTVTDVPPPTEYDDVHTPANVPQVSITAPYDGATITERSFQASVSAWANRGVSTVDYYMDDVLVGRGTMSPFNAAVSVPNSVAKGFHTFKAVAKDDVGNAGIVSITVNFTADPGPLGIQWDQPYPSQSLFGPSFPYPIRFSIEDPRSIRTLTVTARDESDGTEQIIGSINEPSLPNMSLSWSRPPRVGNYKLTVTAALKTGATRQESINVAVR